MTKRTTQTSSATWEDALKSDVGDGGGCVEAWTQTSHMRDQEGGSSGDDITDGIQTEGNVAISRRKLLTLGAPSFMIGIAGCNSPTKFRFTATPIGLKNPEKNWFRLWKVGEWKVTESKKLLGLNLDATLINHFTIYRQGNLYLGVGATPAIKKAGSTRNPLASMPLNEIIDSRAGQALLSRIRAGTALEEGFDRIEGSSQDIKLLGKPTTAVGFRGVNSNDDTVTLYLARVEHEGDIVFGSLTYIDPQRRANRTDTPGGEPETMSTPANTSASTPEGVGTCPDMALPPDPEKWPVCGIPWERIWPPVGRENPCDSFIPLGIEKKKVEEGNDLTEKYQLNFGVNYSRYLPPSCASNPPSFQEVDWFVKKINQVGGSKNCKSTLAKKGGYHFGTSYGSGTGTTIDLFDCSKCKPGSTTYRIWAVAKDSNGNEVARDSRVCTVRSDCD